MASDIPPLKRGDAQDKSGVDKVGKLGEHTVDLQSSVSDWSSKVPKQKLFEGGDFKHQVSLAWEKGFGVLIQLILHKLFGFAAPDLSLSAAQALPKLYKLQEEEGDSAKVKKVMDQIFPNIENFEKEWKQLPPGDREQFYKKLDEASKNIQKLDEKNLPHFEEEKQARSNKLDVLKHTVKGAILVDLKKEFEALTETQVTAKPTLVFDFYKKIESVEKNIGNLAGLKERVQKTFSNFLQARVGEFKKNLKLDTQALALKEKELTATTQALEVKSAELRPKERLVEDVEADLKALRRKDFDRELATEKQKKLEALAKDILDTETEKSKADTSLKKLLEEEANLIKLRDGFLSTFRFSDADKARLAAIEPEITQARTELKEKTDLYTQLSSTAYKDKIVQNLTTTYQALKRKLELREAEFKTLNPEKVKLTGEYEVLREKRDVLENEIRETKAIANQHIASHKQEIGPLARLMVAEFIFGKFLSAENKENSTGIWQNIIIQNRQEIRTHVESQFIKLYGFINPTLKQELDTAFNKLMLV